MRIFQFQGKAFGLTIGDERGTIILGIAEDGAMIEMRQHLLLLTAMLIIVADGAEDEAVAGVVNPVFIMRLRLEQGIARHLTVALDAHSTSIKETVETDEFGECGVGMLLNDLLDAVERGCGLTIATSTGGEKQAQDKRRQPDKRMPTMQDRFHN
ncbi:MAG: hypothetical protein IKH58_07170 [Bacteroidales bacterium]|nr:hypothetical protein [Bacteroidales bacterium]